MTHLADIMNACQFKISDGSEHCWSWAGPNTRYIDFQADGGPQAGSVSVLVGNQEVRKVEVCGPNDEAFAWIDPDLLDDYLEESAARGHAPWIAYDDVEYIVVEDFDLICQIAQVCIDEGDLSEFVEMATEESEEPDVINAQIGLTVEQLADIAKELIVTNQNYSDWLHDAVMNHLAQSLEEIENASSV